MKIFITLLLLLANFTLFGQLKLEHDYQLSSRQKIVRVKLKTLGERYYLESYSEGKPVIKLYHADHSFDKLITFSFPENAKSFSLLHLSESQLHPNNKIEVAYSYTLNYHNYTRIIDETDSVLLETSGSRFSISEIEGLESKLLLNRSVYALPSLTLEHQYAGYVQRVKLPTYGEVYYASNLPHLYDANHVLWKVIPVRPEGNDWTIYHLSENVLNEDTQLELIYSFMIYDQTSIHLNPFYYTRVINEDGEELLALDGVRFAFPRQSKNQPTVLMTLKEVYSTPQFQLEHHYPYSPNRNSLQSGQDHYYITDVRHTVHFFDLDHQVIKSVKLKTPTATKPMVLHVSDKLMNADDQLEIIYYYSSSGIDDAGNVVGEAGQFIRIINESGKILFENNGTILTSVSELEGLPNKLIIGGQVYALPE